MVQPETVAAVAHARWSPAKHTLTAKALEEEVSKTVEEGVVEVVSILLPDNESEQPTIAQGRRAGGTVAGSEGGRDEMDVLGTNARGTGARRAVGEVSRASEDEDLMQVNNDRAARWTRLFAAVTEKRKVPPGARLL
jgi:hypothetical protein